MAYFGDSLGQTRSCYDISFTWTKDHPTEAELQAYLYSYDKLATDALDRIDELSPPTRKPNGCPMQRDLYALVEEHANDDPILGKLWMQVTEPPDWVDWEQIARGQRVVYQYNGQMLLGLLVRSLIGGMGAYRVVETLARTGGFGVEVTRRRLLETFQHFMEVIEDIDSVKPGGKGHVSSVRVRLLHASVRRRIMRLQRQKPDYFDIDSWGVPINDLHQMATISVYSATLSQHTLPSQGVRLSAQQVDDYTALWRWIAHVMGTPIHWMETPAKAKAWTEAIFISEIHPVEKSATLANNILTAESNVPPLYAPRSALAAQVYLLNGDQLSKDLGVEKPGLYRMLRARLGHLIFKYYSFSYWAYPTSWRQQRDRTFLTFAKRMIEDRQIGGLGKRSQFHFQYEPDLDKTTAKADIPSPAGGDSAEWGRLVVLVVVVGTVVATPVASLAWAFLHWGGPAAVRALSQQALSSVGAGSSFLSQIEIPGRFGL